MIARLNCFPLGYLFVELAVVTPLCSGRLLYQSGPCGQKKQAGSDFFSKAKGK